MSIGALGTAGQMWEGSSRADSCHPDALFLLQCWGGGGVSSPSAAAVPMPVREETERLPSVSAELVRLQKAWPQLLPGGLRQHLPR